MHRSLPLALTIGLFITSLAPAADWPGWRGPTGQGISTEKDLPLTWGGKDNENVLWKAILPGVADKVAQDQNQSSPIVVKGRVVVMASYWPKDLEPKQREKNQPEHHVAAFNVANGKLLWNVTVKPGPWKFTDLRGGYTCTTPASDGERIYAFFGSSVIVALDLDGNEVWRQEIRPFNFDVAIACSPVLYGDTILLQCDQVGKSSQMMALDRKTGDIKWRSPRPNVSFGHSTPILARVDDHDMLLVGASNAIQGVNPEDGKVIWWCKAQCDTVSPVFAKGIVFCDSGRGGSIGTGVTPTGSGEVTKSNVKWTIKNIPSGFSSPVIVGDYLYRLTDPGMVRCWKLADGERVYEERLQGLVAAVSPITTPDGRIYCATAGRSYVIKAGPKPEVLGRNDLGDESYASPAVADGKLFLKGKKELFCIGSKK